MDPNFDYRILVETTHRPWSVPRGPWIFRQSWHDLLFLHWPVERDVLRPLVPACFELDLNGTAWVSVVAFRMSHVAPRGVPAVPGISAFPEINVRTYVRIGGKPGVFFFSLDAASAIAVLVGRRVFHLPYFAARMSFARSGGHIRYESRRSGDSRAVFAATCAPAGPHHTAAEGSLDYFLTERYCLYTLGRRGRPKRVEIHHPPWSLQRVAADIALNTLVAAAGIRVLDAEPLTHYAARQDVVSWPMTAAI
jgi:uncharacterized protein YqjF (DUF2071 family)